MTAVAARAQFVVEKQNGSPVTVEGNLHFAKDATGENWSVGETYDPAMDLSQIAGIEAQSESGDPFAGKTCWVYGVKAPDFPGQENVATYPTWKTSFPAGEWMRYDYASLQVDFEVQQLTWIDTCGWYDCNKTYEYDNAEDKNMCWAAAASDLLHWWLVNNKPYIDRYDQLYGQQYDFARPSEVFKAPDPVLCDYVAKKSEIFKFFITSFQNKAGWCSSGVNWFVNGNIANISAPFRNPDMYETFHGFFPKVFSQDDAVAEDSRVMTKENFNALLKKAFTENKAIGAAVYDIVGKGTGLHGLAIWGAEFDEDGYVSYIYYCDNNLPDQDANGASIYRLAITYAKESGNSEVTYFMQLPKPFGGVQQKYLVSALFLVDLRQDIWERALGKLDDK